MVSGNDAVGITEDTDGAPIPERSSSKEPSVAEVTAAPRFKVLLRQPFRGNIAV